MRRLGSEQTRTLAVDHLFACYDRLLANVGDAAERIGPGIVTSHWPLVGGDGEELEDPYRALILG